MTLQQAWGAIDREWFSPVPTQWRPILSCAHQPRSRNPMADSSQGLHEEATELSALTRDRHRALVSLQEELEAVDWYRQRAEACRDGELREVLLHNMREEIEHGAMILEWLRRRDAAFDEHLRTYLFTDVPITAAEEVATNGDGDSHADTATPQPATTEPAAAPQSLTLGSLKQRNQEVA
ncbi:MAG: ferritin [Halochromatium sp.]|uniref:ferritin family protein n=1 Tax=Halochromatium sp. TaxID=2049430 RepID=UPI00397A180D